MKNTVEHSYKADPFKLYDIEPNDFKNKFVLVVHDLQAAIVMSRFNKVVYITDDEDKYDWFKRNVVYKSAFGKDDAAYFIQQDWTSELKDIFDELVKDMKKKFDCCIMNPPWGTAVDSTIDVKIWKICQKYCKEIAMISSGAYLYSKRKDPDVWKHVKSAAIIINPFQCGPKTSPVVTWWQEDYKNDGYIDVSDTTGMGWNGRYKYNEIEETKCSGIEFFNEHSKKFVWSAGMCNGPNHKGLTHDNGEFIYYNKKLGYAMPDITGKPIVCMGTFENQHDPIYFELKSDGAIIWICKNERIRNNIKYWLDTPFIYMFRKRYVKSGRQACTYNVLPQPKTFDMPEEDFIAYCNGIADGFNTKHTNEEIFELFAHKGSYSCVKQN